MFPIFLKLDSRRVLVVGAGNIAEGKIQGLLTEHARVKVVAPEATIQIHEWAGSGALVWQAKAFEPSDLDGAFLTVVATSSREVNAKVFAEASERNILCNVVDDPEYCDFYYPAVVRRGDLQIAISTNGRSPALAQRLRQELEQQFGPEYESWLAELGTERDQLNAAELDPESRKSILHELASRRSFEAHIAARKGQGN